jgi:hypothetical protein
MDHGLQTDAADEIEYLASDIAVKARLLTAQAKEIAALRAKVDELTAALREIDTIAVGKKFGASRDMQRRAREALAVNSQDRG